MKSKNELVVDYVPLAYKIAHSYKGRGIDIEELKSIAIQGLVYARDVYDPSRGGFGTIAALNIRGHIVDSFKKQSIRVNLLCENNKQLFMDDEYGLHELDMLEEDGLPADEVIEKEEIRGVLLKAVEKLDIRKRYIIEKRYLQDIDHIVGNGSGEYKTLKEIAKVLGVSLQRVAELEQSAIKFLRKELINEINI